ncbi:MAG: hypothetical protein JXR56_03450 [Candidatus Cloacimonetes bacterium]|nr:hypothetical protein [Candidatus Cloacimonadota bacterium]
MHLSKGRIYIAIFIIFLVGAPSKLLWGPKAEYTLIILGLLAVKLLVKYFIPKIHPYYRIFFIIALVVYLYWRYTVLPPALG